MVTDWLDMTLAVDRAVKPHHKLSEANNRHLQVIVSVTKQFDGEGRLPSTVTCVGIRLAASFINCVMVNAVGENCVV